MRWGHSRCIVQWRIMPSRSTSESVKVGCRRGTSTVMFPDMKVWMIFHHPFGKPFTHSYCPARRGAFADIQANTTQC